VQPGLRRPGGLRPMHPTSLRPESAQPVPTEQRRHQAKPGGRPANRKRELEEGNLRERVSKRQAIAEPPPIDREITVAEGVTVKELSEKLGVKANLVIKKLVEKKIFATINQTLDVKLAEELAREFGASTNQVSYEQESTQDVEQAEETKDLVRRAPVVTIMGHVDHGKTSLLDAIRQTNVAGREAGGITQHIGAYYIEHNNRKIVFIDTPGHQAFTRMRARGAKVTDIVVLVVSADDGVMPQTLEAIDHARAAGVPIIVAINKIDKPDAQPERVKQQLADRGLLAEDWGGDVVMVPVSAKAKQNLDLLLEMILLVADIQDLKANPARPAVGTVLEAKLDKGRGPVATMLVRNGTLHTGDFFICGALFNKVRAMFDDRGNAVKDAEPSMPVEVIGLESLPEVGDSFQVVSDTSKAKQIVIYRESKARDAAMARGARVATLDSLAQQFKEGDLKDLNLIIKADVGGTAEVLSDTLQNLSNDKVRVRVLRAGVGAITEDDVLLGSASDALIIGFNVRAERSAQATADQQKIGIRLHSIIYELIDEVTLAMTGMLDPVYKETVLGHAEVRETFKISKVGVVAGCYVSDGAIRRDSQVRLMRDGELIHTGKIEALKRFKNDSSEVKNGLECGISLTNFNNIQIGDVIEAFTMERVAAQLQPSGA
jgi:translation initiation factor IF-2